MSALHHANIFGGALYDPGLFIDGFAGGGGASEGIEQAIGRPIDHAINHSETALAIHRANHPGTEHHHTDIRVPFLPKVVTRGLPVWGAWFSPDCKEFSKAKSGPVKDRSIRTLADEIPYWIAETQPEVVYVENVEEFEDWGPLEQGADGKWRVVLDRKGEDFKKWVGRCRRLGYRVEWKQLRACDYGAPTSRKRLYIVMRRDKQPIVWPEKTHGPANDNDVIAGKKQPYRTAAECIDWSIQCPSIFDRKKPHADATNRRVAHGIVRHVIEAAKRGNVFFIPGSGAVAHLTKFHSGSVGAALNQSMPTVTGNGQPTRQAGAMPLGLVEAKIAPFISYGQHGGANRPADEPHHTIAASKKDTNGIVGATLIGVGGRRGQSPPMAMDGTYPTTTVKGDAAVATAFMTRFYGSDKRGAGGDPDKPLPTARAGGTHHGVVAAHMAQFNTNPNGTVNVGHGMHDLVSTVATKGPHQGVVETTLIEEGDLPPDMLERAVKVAAFLVKYYGTDGESETAQTQSVDRPIDVITVKARFAVVTVTIDAKTYVIVDIGLRMLTPRELARAQGFPDSYVLDPECWYTTDPSPKYPQGRRKFGRLPVSKQISAIGNSVCPPVARALVAANQPGLQPIEYREAA
jgi:DNA (cytosine-5)-methyltransferase 1